MSSLAGKVAVVTGGTRGLGLAMSTAYAAHGATVVVASRKEEACAKVAAALGGDALGVPFHVGRWEDCDRLVDTVYDRFGRIDVLVNNAGMSPLYESIDQVSEDLFDKVLSVNLKGPFRLCALVGTRMAKGDGGSIINVSSIAAVQPSPIEIPYAAAKAGLNNLTIGLAHMLGPKVRVNTIMPGAFLTDVSKAWDLESFRANAKTRIPLQRAGEADEVVGAALYLAGDESSYTTGSIIKIDGGMAFSPG